MKKSLIALAALAATASFAQSTVTLYGQADAAYTSAKSGANTVTGIFGAGRGSNFVGFMGSEDLGGGWKANFKLEAGYNLDNGVGASSNANNQATGGLTTQSGAATAPQLNGATTPSTDRASLGGAQGLTFNRWSYAGLSNAGVGEFRVGREYTPAFQAVLAADVVGSNGAGNSLNMTLMISGQSANAVATAASASNGISYESPSLSGFKAKVQMFQGENPNTGVATTLNTAKNGDGTSYHLSYAAGPISAGYGATASKSTAVVGTTTGLGLPGKYDLTTAYARYDFGVALATIGQATEKQAGSAATASDMKNASTIIGVRVPMGAITLNANYITSKYTVAGAATGEATQLAIQGMYAMSKRTDLYATYAVTDNSVGTTYGLGNGAGRMVTVNGAAAKSTGMQIGMRHNF
jgi:predicted porin